MHWNHPEAVTTQITGFIPKGFDSVGLGQRQKICILNQFSGGAHAAGQGTILGRPFIRPVVWYLVCVRIQ